ncbi:MAG: class I SAM-dependent methyltransferase [Rubrivivax sp.]|nr:class I SAM-dependent methyltransferase [Rubrivivax sp.]
MNRSLFGCGFLMAFCLAAAAGGVLAQEPGPSEFQPVVGQPGKDVVWVPTPQELVDKMLDLAKVTPEDYVIDLGSGDGRTVIAAAKRGATALGIEYNPDMVELSRQNAAQAGVTDKARFAQADLFESDLTPATVITMFLLPDINMRLRPTLLSLKPGTRIVSNSFTMEDWIADASVTAESGCTTWCTAHLWIVPARAEGKWKLPQGELNLQQSFQMLSGTLESGGKKTPIQGKMKGDEITFTAGDAEYIGRVYGETMTGKLKYGLDNSSWSATLVK